MDLAEYNLLKQEAMREHERNIDAIERVWRMTESQRSTTDKAATKSKSQTTPAAAKRISPSINGSTKVGKGDILNVMRETIGAMHGTFTSNDLRAALAKRIPDLNQGTYYSVLKRLQSKGELIQVQANVGRKPAIFKHAKDK